MYDYYCAVRQSSRVGGELDSAGDSISAPAALSARYAVLSLGRQRYSPMLVAICKGQDASISSQIATKMAVQGIQEEAFSCYEQTPAASLAVAEHAGDEKLCIEIIRASFKRANQQVHDYSQRMLSSRAVCCHGTMAVLIGRHISVGRVGQYESFLWRAGQIHRFFQPEPSREAISLALSCSIGKDKRVWVELASTELEKSDVVIITTQLFSEKLISRIKMVVQSLGSLDEGCCDLAEFGVEQHWQSREGSLAGLAGGDSVVFMLRAESPVIDLKDVILEE
ncbi:MAG: hypothetical protein IT291_02935 [Deltaproteobacteria bacterium]|nr:hypothetical protein [Deltaproteobacteria bacterium]